MRFRPVLARFAVFLLLIGTARLRRDDIRAERFAEADDCHHLSA